MGQEAKKAVVQLIEIGSGQSASLRELEKTRGLFRSRLKKTLSNLPQGQIIEVPVQEVPYVPTSGPIPFFPDDRDRDIESPGDLAAQQAEASR